MGRHGHGCACCMLRVCGLWVEACGYMSRPLTKPADAIMGDVLKSRGWSGWFHAFDSPARDKKR